MRRDLESEIPPAASILIDTSVVLAYLTGSEVASPAAIQLFDAVVASGRNPAAMSVVTVGEILVRPFRVGVSAVATAEGFLRYFAKIRIRRHDLRGRSRGGQDPRHDRSRDARRARDRVSRGHRDRLRSDE